MEGLRMKRTVLEGGVMGVILLTTVLFSLGSSVASQHYPNQRQCMDQQGRTRSEGEIWIAEGCRECRCTSGNVMCIRLEVDCPPRPVGNCVEIPGPCCPEYDCTTPNCAAVLCAGPPGPNCYPIIPPGKCCAVDWMCDGVSGCNDLQGMPRHQGEIWYDPETPCTVCSCHERIVECFTDDLYCNQGCIDRQGVPRNHGEMWQDPIDPCTFCSCDNGEVPCFVRDCPPPPAVPCTHPQILDQCCLDCDPSLNYYN